MKILFLILFFLYPVFAGAETIRVKGGRTVEGELISQTDDTLTVREAVGDGFVENVYDKEPEDKGQASGKNKSGVKTGADAADWDFKQQAEYKNRLNDIFSQIYSLKSMWDSDRSNYSGYKNWFAGFKPMEETFKKDYGQSKLPSYSHMSLVFLKLDQYLSSIGDMERKQKVLDDCIKKNPNSNWIEKLKNYVKLDEDLANTELSEAVRYVNMAKDKLLKK
jgi:hypothetical protein